jgi:hypothetical protein
MKQSHLATAAFWIGLLTLFGWQASAQIPRPPMPIPVAVTPAPRPPASTVALMPPTARLLRSAPTPIPPPGPERPAPIPAMMPIMPRVALPPVEFDHQYAGKLTVLKEDNYVFIRHVCKDTPNAIACSFRTYDSVSGETISCLIMLGPETWEDERAMRHEIGHCNGWTNDHEGARYGD